ncbi:VanZ family protein [Streptomyces sp. NPDC088915]|uniref:VanZ family protein n=1 Tax=Streptomyces sp. NPDC088915 TaxID=3365912 RepID=UPI00381A086C
MFGEAPRIGLDGETFRLPFDDHLREAVLGIHGAEILLFFCFFSLLAAAGAWQARRIIRDEVSITPWRGRAIFGVLATFALAPFLLVTLMRGAGVGSSISLIPFKEFWAAFSNSDVAFSDVTFFNFVGNMLLLVPFGAALSFLWPSPRRTLKVALTASVISLAVEAAQYALSLGRVSSIDDVLLNTIGATMGALLVRRWSRKTQEAMPPTASGTPVHAVR